MHAHPFRAIAVTGGRNHVSTFDEVFERIKLSTHTRTQVELAEVLDIRQSSISDAKRRNSVPSDWYMKLFEKFGLNPDWLKKGVGPMYLRTEQGYEPLEGPAAGRVFEDSAKFGDPDARNAVVTIHSMQCETDDNGQRVLKGIGKLCIPQSFAGTNIQVLRVEASGMEPLIHKGAYVGLDTNQKNVLSGEIYGVFVPYEGISLKRLFLDAANNRFIMRSENQSHPEQSLPVEKRAEAIIGRVAWVLQTL